jgi:hypothetical protein
MKTTAFLLTSALALAAVALPARAQAPLGTAFTYQGVLSENGVPLNGADVADIEANLYDAASGGNQVGGAVIVYNVDFDQGQFTILLDFGTSPFAGEARWLELMVRKPPGSGQWVPLSPRQPLTATPYGLYTLAAGNADLLDGQQGTFYQSATNLNAGTLADARLSSNVTLLNNAQTFTGAKTFSTAPGFTAAGAPFTVTATGLVSNLNADLLDGQQGAYYQNAGNINAGTLADARLSTNVTLLNNAQTFTGAKTFSTAPSFSAAGTPFAVTATGLVSNLNADLLDSQQGTFYQNAGNLNAGTLADARLSSNVALLNTTQTFTTDKYFTGNVGIGTSTPTAPLDVASTLPRPSIVTRGGADYATVTGQTINIGHWDGTTYTDRLSISSAGVVSIPNTVNVTGAVDAGSLITDAFRLGTSTTGGYVLTADATGVGTWQVAAPGGGIGGSGTTNYIPKFTGPTAIGNSAVYESGGNVGIGTTTPARPLSFSDTVGGKISLWGQGSTYYGLGIQSNIFQIHSATASSDIVFGYGSSTALTETMRIKGTGDVGIGDSTPNAKLDVAGALRSSGSGTSENVWAQLDNAGTNGAGLTMRASWGSAYGHADVRYDGDALRLLATMSDGDPPPTNGVSIANNGFVGVGVADPGPGNARLQVLSSSTTGYALKAEATGANTTGLFASGGAGGNAADFKGRVRLFDPNTNAELIRIGGGGTGVGGYVGMYNSDGARTIELDAHESGFPAVRLFRNNGTTMAIEMLATEGADGGQITLFNSAGNATITLDAEHGGVGGTGRVITQVLEITGGSDLSEQFDVIAPDGTPEPGMVVVIDPENPGQLKLATQAYDRKVAGVISGAGGVRPGMLMGQRDTAADGQYPVALTGRVWCWCDASFGAIEPGDLLTTSSTPGHAMRIGDNRAAPRGCVIGKAMTSLDEGRGLVLVLVTLQ